MAPKKLGFGHDLKQVSRFCYKARNLREINLALVHDFFGGTLVSCEKFLDVLLDRGIIAYKSMSNDEYVFLQHVRRRDKILCTAKDIDKYPGYHCDKNLFNIPLFEVSDVVKLDRLAFLKPHFRLSPSPRIPTQFITKELQELNHYLNYLNNSSRFFVYVDKLEIFGEMLDIEESDSFRYVDLVVDIKPKVKNDHIYNILCNSRFESIAKHRSHVLDFFTSISDAPNQELLYVLNKHFPDFGFRAKTDQVYKFIEAKTVFEFAGEFEVRVANTDILVNDKDIIDEIVKNNRSLFDEFKNKIGLGSDVFSDFAEIDDKFPVQ